MKNFIKYSIALLSVLCCYGTYAQNNYSGLQIKEKYDDIYTGAYNYPPSIEGFNTAIHDQANESNLAQHGGTMESMLIMYETTKDKAYLYKFIKWAKEIQAYRSVGLFFFHEYNVNLNFNARLLWSMSHFVYLVNVKYPELQNVSLNPHSNLNLSETDYSTFGEFASWLSYRVQQTLDKCIDSLWTSEYYAFAFDKNNKEDFSDGKSFNVHALNFQVPWGLTLIYMYLSTGRDDYGVKAIQMARIYLVNEIKLWKDDCQNVPKCFTDNVLAYMNNNSYSWGHNGWGVNYKKKQCGGIFSNREYRGSCSKFYELTENIAYATWDILFPLLYNKFAGSFNPHLTSGQYFEDYQLVRFRNTFTKNVYAGNGNFHNGVDGTNTAAFTDGNDTYDTILPMNYFKSSCIAWMSLYKFDDVAGESPNVYEIIMDYYTGIMAMSQNDSWVRTYFNPMQFKGLADVVSAQWDKECYNLTLKNRDVVYNQDFSAKNELTIDPAQANSVYANNQNSFADPVITDDKFIIEPNTEVNVTAGKVIHLKPGFHAKAGSHFHASISGFSCNSGSNKSFCQGKSSDNEGRNYHINNIQYIDSSQISSDKNIMESYSTILFYPNPAINEFTISINTTDDIQYDIEIKDVFGKKVLIKNNLSNNAYIDISNLKSGVYFVVVKTKENEVVKKIIKG